MEGSENNGRVFQIVSTESSRDSRISKHILETPGKRGTFELGTFTDGESFDICVSTMAGCPLKCQFCAIPYSEIPYERRLDANEMYEQVVLAFQDNGDAKDIVVGFMGNGEPFLNFDAIVDASAKILTDPNLPIRALNISTTGIRPQKISELADTEFGRSGKGKVQFSLLSLDPAVREEYIPNVKSLQECLPHLDQYAAKTGQAVKYNVMLVDGLNDSLEHAEALAEFIMAAPQLRRIKISTFNPIPGGEINPSSEGNFEAFIKCLRQKGVDVKVFRGDTDESVLASCGQMRARVHQTLTSK